MITKLSEDKENVPLQNITTNKKPSIIATPVELKLVTHLINDMPNLNMLIIKMEQLLKTQWVGILKISNICMFEN